MSRIYSFFNQKGGVGKTTINTNLAASLSKLGYKVLVVDADPQGNATSSLGINKSSTVFNIYDVLIGDASCSEAIIRTSYEGLYIIPSNVQLAGVEIEIVSQSNREMMLREALHSVKGEYDFIFLDCPPSLGLITINALVASDYIIIPIQCEYFALEGVSQLINTFKLVRKSLNKELQISGVIISMYDARMNLTQQVVDEVEKYFDEKVFKTKIPRNVKLAEAPSFGMPIIYYDEKSKGAESFTSLANEFISRL